MHSGYSLFYNGCPNATFTDFLSKTDTAIQGFFLGKHNTVSQDDKMINLSCRTGTTLNEQCYCRGNIYNPDIEVNTLPCYSNREINPELYAHLSIHS